MFQNLKLGAKISLGSSFILVFMLLAGAGVVVSHEFTTFESRISEETQSHLNLCLFVDELLGQQQTVIKSLSDYIGALGNVSGVTGCTILGNGEVCLILDVRGLEEHINQEEASVKTA